jgi:hypothetical protein
MVELLEEPVPAKRIPADSTRQARVPKAKNLLRIIRKSPSRRLRSACGEPDITAICVIGQEIIDRFCPGTPRDWASRAIVIIP